MPCSLATLTHSTSRLKGLACLIVELAVLCEKLLRVGDYYQGQANQAMNYKGIVIGIVAFLIIGVFHPIIVAVEYHWGAGMWPMFVVAGSLALLMSVLTRSTIGSSILGVLAFTLFWSVRELIVQEQRVERGWFPTNPAKQLQGFEQRVMVVMLVSVTFLLLVGTAFLWWQWRHRTRITGK